MRVIPPSVQRFVPKGHRLWFAERQGALRMDRVQCVCGLGLTLEKTIGEDGEPVTVEPDAERWLEAVNQCRVAMHSARTPCLPVMLDGTELPLREAPPAATPIAATPSSATAEPAPRPVGRPRKEPAHAA